MCVREREREREKGKTEIATLTTDDHITAPPPPPPSSSSLLLLLPRSMCNVGIYRDGFNYTVPLRRCSSSFYRVCVCVRARARVWYVYVCVRESV